MLDRLTPLKSILDEEGDDGDREKKSADQEGDNGDCDEEKPPSLDKKAGPNVV